MFEFFVNAFNLVLYKPLFNALILLYHYLPGHDFGVAVVVLTVAIRLVLYPTFLKSIKSQKAMSEIQPKLKEIQKKYKDNKEKLAQATMELYKKEKVSPFSGCLPLLIQLPILIAVYRVFWRGLDPAQMANLYNFVVHPASLNASFLGLVDLAGPSAVLAVLVGVFQFLQTKMITPKTKAQDKGSGFAGMMQKQMLYFFPILIVFIVWKLPSALSLYLIINSLFTIAQQYFIVKKTKLSEAQA